MPDSSGGSEIGPLPDEKLIREWALAKLPEHLELDRVEFSFGTHLPPEFPHEIVESVAPEKFVLCVTARSRVEEDDQAEAAEEIWFENLEERIRRNWPTEMRILFRFHYDSGTTTPGGVSEDE